VLGSQYFAAVFNLPTASSRYCVPCTARRKHSMSIQYKTSVEWDVNLVDLEFTDTLGPNPYKGLVKFAIKVTTGAPAATAGYFLPACQILNAYDKTWYENTGSTASPVWSLVPSSGSGITTLTGDVTAGPGAGSQAATIAAGAVTTSKIANNAVDGTKIAITSQTTGSIMYYNGTDWVNLAPGTVGQVLTMAGGVPTWA